MTKNKEEEKINKIIKEKIEFFKPIDGKIVIENGHEFIEELRKEARRQREEEQKEIEQDQIENLNNLVATKDNKEIDNLIDSDVFEFFEEDDD